MESNYGKVAPEEMIGEFVTGAALNMCAICDKREYEVVTEKICSGVHFERIVCKHREECRRRAMYELGEGGVK